MRKVHILMVHVWEYYSICSHSQEVQWQTAIKAKEYKSQRSILFPGPANITSKPTDPPATPPLRVTVASTQAPTGPLPTVSSTTAEAETTTTPTTAAAPTPSPPSDDTLLQADPNATWRVIPIPPTPTDAPQQPPNVETPLPPATDSEDNTTTVAPGTPTPETYIDTDVVVPETTADGDMGFSTEPSPHGEYSYVNVEFYRIWKCFTIYLDLPVVIKHRCMSTDAQAYMTQLRESINPNNW